MKRIHIAAGGRPLSNDDIQILQEEVYKAVEQQYDGLGAFIVSGCAVSGTTIDAGLVYLDGKILPFPGVSNVTFPAYIKQAAVQDLDVVAYETGGSHPKRKLYSAELVSAAPASGSYIVMSSTGGRSYFDAISSEVVRMRGNQTISGNKTFSNKVVVEDFISLVKMSFDGHFINALKTSGLDLSNDTLPTTKAVKEYVDAAYDYRGSGGDANSYIEDGVAQGRPFSANHPEGASHGAMFIAGSPSGTRQVFMDDGGNVFYRAQSWDGIWSTWRKSWHSDNFNPANKADITTTDSLQDQVIANDSDIAALNTDKANKTQPHFTNFTLLNGAGAGAGYPPAYMKDTLGFVHLRGSTDLNGVMANPICNLPAGYRPAQGISFSDSYRAISISATGDIDAMYDGSEPMSANGAVNFNGITFFAEV